MSLANPLPSSSDPLKPSNSWNRKRRESEEDNDNNCDNSNKKPRFSWYVTLESESSHDDARSDEESENESVYSIQGQETEFARDTSDTSTWVSTSEYQQDLSFHVEYDVATASESDNPFINVSSSDPEDIFTVNVIAVKDSDLDQQQVEESDESLSSVDSEIGKADYWACIQCNMKNNNPLFRYCERCFQLRKNFFPPRPKRKKKYKKVLPSSNKPENETSEIINSQLSTMDSGLGGMSVGSQQSSMSPSVSPTNFEIHAEVDVLLTPSSSQTEQSSQNINDTISKGTVNDDTTSGRQYDNITGFHIVNKNTDDNDNTKAVRSINLNNNLNNTDTMSVSDTKNFDKTESNTKNRNGEIHIDDQLNEFPRQSKSDELCLVCTVNPKDGAFVHGNVLHICCCYRCAIKVWKSTKHCPICKRKVTNVLKAFYV